MPHTAKLSNFIDKDTLNSAEKHLIEVIGSDDFLANKGLNSDIPFHICPYSPTIHNAIEMSIKMLINTLQDKGTTVLEINLFDLAIQILKDEGDWEWLQDNETSLSRNELKDELQGMLDVESVLTVAMVERMQANPHDVLLISGVGAVFPYIRSHNILNNLQSYAKEKPTVLFFPGIYQHSLAKGASLNLFGSVVDDKYYRAFNILERAI